MNSSNQRNHNEKSLLVPPRSKSHMDHLHHDTCPYTTTKSRKSFISKLPGANKEHVV